MRDFFWQFDNGGYVRSLACQNILHLAESVPVDDGAQVEANAAKMANVEKTTSFVFFERFTRSHADISSIIPLSSAIICNLCSMRNFVLHAQQYARGTIGLDHQTTNPRLVSSDEVAF